MQQRSRALDALWHRIVQARLDGIDNRNRIGRHKQVQSKLNLNSLDCAPDHQLVLQAPSAPACHRWHPIVHVEKLTDLNLEPRGREIPNASILPNKEKLENSKTPFSLKQRFKQLKLKHPKHPGTTKPFSCSQTLHPQKRKAGLRPGLAFASKKAYLQLFFRPKYAASNSFTSSHCIQCLARVMTLNFRMMPVPNAHNAGFPVFSEILAQRSA